MLGMDCVILLWHSLSLPYNYFAPMHKLKVLVRIAIEAVLRSSKNLCFKQK